MRSFDKWYFGICAGLMAISAGILFILKKTEPAPVESNTIHSQKRLLQQGNNRVENWPVPVLSNPSLDVTNKNILDIQPYTDIPSLKDSGKKRLRGWF